MSNDSAYAELDFDDPNYATQIDWGYISIVRVATHTGSVNNNLPGYTKSWFSGYYPVYGTSEYQAWVHFQKPLFPGSGDTVDCVAFTSWNYSTSTSTHGSSAGDCGQG